MDVFLVGNVFLVEVVDVDLLVAVARLEEVDKVALELVAVFVDVLLGVFADDEHLAHVALRHAVLLEGVGVAALLFADLAVPSQALEAFGFEFVVEVFGRADLCFGHFGGVTLVSNKLIEKRGGNVRRVAGVVQL